MKRVFHVACLATLLGTTIASAEVTWELQGEFVALKPGTPEVAVLRLADGRTVEVPVDSLSESSQAAARKAAVSATPSGGAGEDDAGDGAVTVRGPFGKPVRVAVPECIKDVECDAIHCRTAADAADVYRLFVSGTTLSAEQRAAADGRLREWVAMADKGLVRLGDRWVVPAEAKAAAQEADKVVAHGLDLMQRGTAELAEEELRKAARIDPEAGRASFAMGLAYALVARNPVKAVEHLADVVRREPGNGAALNDLAVLEVVTRRYATAVGHFREALESAADPLPVANNVVWALQLASAAKLNPALSKNKMPDKTIEDLNALARMLTQDLKIEPDASVAAPTFLGPDGAACAAATLPEIAKRFEAAGESVETRRALGFVVAPEHVVCPRRVLRAADGSRLDEVTVTLPSDPARRLAATVIAMPDDGEVALLRCAGLSVAPLPLAKTMPPQPEITVVDRVGHSWLDARPRTARGMVLTPALQVQARGRFVHTAVVHRGLGGGPILDGAGHVIGMVGVTPRTDTSGNAAGFGVPVERILPLVQEHLPDIEPDATATATSKGAAAEQADTAGTIVVSAIRTQPVSRDTVTESRR